MTKKKDPSELKKVGRPSYYEEELGRRIAIHVQHGATLAEAAHSEGVPRSTADLWSQQHPEFLALLTIAKSRQITDNLALIQRHAQKDWRAAEKLLIWADPKRFGQKVELEVSIKVLEQLSDEDLYSIITSSELPDQAKSSSYLRIEEKTEATVIGELVS